MIQSHTNIAPRIPVPGDRIEAFCRKWSVRQLSLFGSVLRDDFRPESDVDVLVVFDQGITPDPGGWFAMEDELRAIFGRDVDLVERRLIVNPYRRHEILTTRRILYAA